MRCWRELRSPRARASLAAACECRVSEHSSPGPFVHGALWRSSERCRSLPSFGVNPSRRAMSKQPVSLSNPVERAALVSARGLTLRSTGRAGTCLLFREPLWRRAG